MLNLIPMLETDDISETIDFYTQQLNFELKDTHVSNGKITWIMLKWGQTGIMFSTRFEATKSSPCQMTGSLYLYPENVYELWENIKDRANVEWPLQEFDYGMTEFAITDNNGYRLIFGQ